MGAIAGYEFGNDEMPKWAHSIEICHNGVTDWTVKPVTLVSGKPLCASREECEAKFAAAFVDWISDRDRSRICWNVRPEIEETVDGWAAYARFLYPPIVQNEPAPGNIRESVLRSAGAPKCETGA